MLEQSRFLFFNERGMGGWKKNCVDLDPRRRSICATWSRGQGNECVLV